MEDQAQFLRDLVGSRTSGGIRPTGARWIIAFASGAAGAGKTTLARNVAAICERGGRRVHLADCRDLTRLEEILGRLERSGDGHGAADSTAASGMPEVVVFDLCAGTSSIVLRALSVADEPVILVLPGPEGIRDASRLIAMIASTPVPRVPSVRLAVNRVSSVIEGRDTALEVIRSCPASPGSPEMEYCGCVFDDDAVGKDMGSGSALVDAAPGSRAAIAIVHLVERLERSRAVRNSGRLHYNNAQMISELDAGSGLSLL